MECQWRESTRDKPCFLILLFRTYVRSMYVYVFDSTYNLESKSILYIINVSYFSLPLSMFYGGTTWIRKSEAAKVSHLSTARRYFLPFLPPSLSLFLYLLYLVFAILLCCLTVQYFAVHPLSDRLSCYTLHAFLQQHRISQPLAAFPPFRSLPYSLGFPLTRFPSIIAHHLFQTSHD